MKKVIDVNGKGKVGPSSRLLYVLGAFVAVAFVLLLVVGFENILGLLRYRVTLFLAIGPIFALFLWCAYKAFDSRNKL